MKKIMLIALMFLTSCGGQATTQLTVYKVTEKTHTTVPRLYAQDGRRFAMYMGGDSYVNDVYQQYVGKTICVNYSKSSIILEENTITSVCSKDVIKGVK